MIHTKLGLLSLCAAVLGVMAISASAAQGATLSWLILNQGGTAVFLKALLSGQAESPHLTLEGEAGTFPIAVTCTSFALNGVNLEVSGKLTEGGKATFTGCKLFQSAPLTNEYTECTVNTAGMAVGTVQTNEFKGQLVLVGTKLLAKIEPKAGPTGNFVSLLFRGAGCALPELNQVHGTFYVKDCENLATTHLEHHLIQEDSENTGLYIGAHSIEQLLFTNVYGSAWVALTGTGHVGLKWGAMDV
jgi:hypothetical protein